METITMWKKILAGLLILAGAILIFSSQINEQYLNLQAKQTIKEAHSVTPEQIKENTEKTLPGPQEEALYDFSQVEPVGLEESLDSFLIRLRQAEANMEEEPVLDEGSTTSGTTTAGDSTKATPKPQTSGTTQPQTAKPLSKYSKSYIIGILKIPTINLEMGVLKGVLNDNLYIGAGTMRKDQIMGQGNYPIAGHHMRMWEILFNRVPSLKNGDKMYITDKNNIYTYQVYANVKVDESETRVIYAQIAVQKGNPVLTLVTCFNRNEPDIRVIVHGELVNTQAYSEATFNGLK